MTSPPLPRLIRTSRCSRFPNDPVAVNQQWTPERQTEGGMPMDNHSAHSPRVPDGPALLARLRDGLQAQVLGLLEADPAVAGVALVGSLGRGQEDNWSDIDLLILASGQFIGQF